MLEADKTLPLKGKGHELGDFNKVMNIYKNWHYEAGPKLEFEYFTERV